MIPIKLSLHNFMCYRDNVPPLSFDGIHTACISGDNGNGKSTLVDAITWALWGKTRAKSDDDLIHLGQTEMWVEFDFAVGGHHYRIIRSHARPKRSGGQGRTSLELQIVGGDGFRAITGNTITQTQQAIIDILHMDYQTFVNSSLLLQGRADAFTVKRPLERKQVLADILGLSFYDGLAERAKNRAKEHEMVREQMAGTIREITGELSQEPVLQSEFEAGSRQLADIEEEMVGRKSQLEDIRQKREALENDKRQLAQLEGHIDKTAQDLERWNGQIVQHLQRMQEYQELLDQRPVIEEGYRSFTAAKQMNDELNRKLGLVNMMNERKHQIEMSIARAGQALLKDHAVAQNQVSELETIVQSLPLLKKDLCDTQARLARLSERSEKLQGNKQASRELMARLNYMESSRIHLEREIKEVEEKLSLLRTKEGNKCPLCETDLAEDGLKLIEIKYNGEKQGKVESLKRNGIELVQKKAELEQSEREIVQLETDLNQDRVSLQSRVDALNQEISRAEKASDKLKETRRVLAGIEEHLTSRDFAAVEQQALEDIEKELAALGYSPDQHEESHRRLADLERYGGLKQRLGEAERLISQVKEAVGQAEEASRELRCSLESDRLKKGVISKELAQLPVIVAELTRAEAAYELQTALQKRAQEALGGLKEKLKRCRELDIKLQEKDKLLNQAIKEGSIYQELAQAFGKRGVQALLIESALPEIEIEANQLLSHMTDNRMHVKMETQRETKSGSVMETLDIKISDELGTRNYEMFSGGEAFRINFAIRIALSRLLARRAGAPLPTLVIDEGFGTQDSIGIEKIKEAITSIQDDFEKILVITHIEDLRDAFPTRINVRKTADGSTLEVN
ncbi:MAG: SMC family ATPase [Dehalococcoidales bacterium]|nr:SMC family ATPase [Dehalococcoidales bacterium]